MKNSKIILFAVIIASSLNGMILEPLTSTEHALVLREIEKIGIPAMNIEIEKIGYELTEHYHYKVTGLTIKTCFNQEDSAKDQLAKDIFDQIQQVEQEYGYQPNDFMPDPETIEPATNYLSSHTRYFWLEENGKRLPAVRVRLFTMNKPALKKIMADYVH